MNYEEIIEKIEDILDEGKPSVMGGGTKIKVDGDAIRECLQELSSSVPAEIIQARKIAAERREILQEARNMSEKMGQDARALAAKLTDEHEITRNAKEESSRIINEARVSADDIIEKANASANQITENAKKWSFSMRSSASEFVNNILDECEDYLSKDIEHYTRSLDDVRNAASKLKNIAVKKTDEPDDEDEQ